MGWLGWMGWMGWLLLQPMWPGVEQTTTVFHRQQADVASLESARILRDFEAVKA